MPIRSKSTARSLLAGFALRRERVEFLLERFLGGFARVDRAALAARLSPRHCCPPSAHHATHQKGSVCDLHPQILEEGLDQEFNSLQAQREGLRSLHQQPAARGLGLPARGL